MENEKIDEEEKKEFFSDKSEDFKKNWDEGIAKKNGKICCHDCRGYRMYCNMFISKYHKPCENFEWW